MLEIMPSSSSSRSHFRVNQSSFGVERGDLPRPVSGPRGHSLGYLRKRVGVVRARAPLSLLLRQRRLPQRPPTERHVSQRRSRKANLQAQEGGGVLAQSLREGVRRPSVRHRCGESDYGSLVVALERSHLGLGEPQLGSVLDSQVLDVVHLGLLVESHPRPRGGFGARLLGEIDEEAHDMM
ncbi:hypothetical protein ACHAWF_003383 [Thalassiosira exigua]